MKKIKLFQSIRARLTVTVSLLLLGTIGSFWLANQIFLPGFYQYSKCQKLSSIYEQVYQMVEKCKNTESKDASNGLLIEELLGGHSSTLDEATELSIEKLSEDSGVRIYIIGNWEYFYSRTGPTYRGNLIYPSENMREKVDSSDQQHIFEQFGNNYGSYSGIHANGLKTTVLFDKEDYQIVKIHDNKLDSDYLELVGDVLIGEDIATMYIRCNFESIQESVALTSRFLLYLAVAAIVVGGAVMLVISDNFTKPIRELSKIAGEMSELKFETKYTDNRTDEIGKLGYSINMLSGKLEETISELKEANNELQSDIADKIQIDEMRKDFLSNVTHELKTPIALIQGYAEGLQDNINDDPESREFYCEVIIDEANKMNNMVKKLLNLNQIEFGKNQIEIERFDVTQMIQSVLNSNRILMEQKGVKLDYKLEEPVYVWSDEYMAQEVFSNYVSNALNHVDGAMKIKIELHKLENKIRISVFNSGNPIPEEELEKIWIKFYKVDKARTREYGGSGIGLSIVKAIMQSMHQECGVDNKEDGVEFWFELDADCTDSL